MSTAANSNKCDIWSIGIIYFEMLFGTNPFPSKSLNDFINKVLNNKLEFPTSIIVS